MRKHALRNEPPDGVAEHLVLGREVGKQCHSQYGEGSESRDASAESKAGDRRIHLICCLFIARYPSSLTLQRILARPPSQRGKP
jgi:hypothetical protein